MAVWLGDDQELDALFGTVRDLVRHPGLDLKAFSGHELVLSSVGLEDGRPGEDEEELASHPVQMPHLGGAGRHSLANDAQRGLVNEVPSVAPATPRVVVGRRE